VVLALPLMMILLVVGASGGGSGAAQAASSVPAAGAGAVASGGSATANEATGARLAAALGWTGTQDTCLDELWTRESGWSATAKNASSGAYGISQALGHLPDEDQGQVTAEDLALNREGDNYPPPYTAANPAPWGDSDASAQISWGLAYIGSAYGTPCQAWDHEETDGFY